MEKLTNDQEPGNSRKVPETETTHLPARMTTLCYLEKDDSYLMLHRIVKKHDENKDKWIGVGGHVEMGESPEECLIREVKEETGLVLTSYRFRGLITFVSEAWGTEYMCLYTADGWEGTLSEGQMRECREGVLEWVKKEQVCFLNVWEGDKIFFRLLKEEEPFFSLKLRYGGLGEKEHLAEAVLNGKPMELFDIRTSDGAVTGVVRERSIAHMDGSLHGTAHIWVLRLKGDGKFDVLLQKRSMEKDGFPGFYDTSSAGHIPAGEDYLESAVRELGEELGIRAKEEELHFMDMYEAAEDTEFHGRRFCNRELAAVYLYWEPVTISQMTLQKEEVESVIWIDYEECLKRMEEGTLKHCVNVEEFRHIPRALKRYGK